MNTDGRIRVLIVDDHTLFAAGLHELLSFHPDLDVVAIATSAEDGLRLATDLAPDVVLMDLNMPGMDGVTATSRLSASTAAAIGPAVIALTMYDDDTSLFAVLRAGARGFVLKGAHQEELLAAIRAVARGEVVFDARVADRVLAALRTPRTEAVALPELTDRERQVLGLLAAGKPTADIARDLALAPKTVRNHLSNIFVKLQVPDRTQAVLRAREAGLIDRG